VLSIKHKFEIIKKLEKGRDVKQFSLQYGIGEQTVRDLKRRRMK
jgi:hypothetical protein